VTDALRVALLGYGLGGRVFHAPLVSATPGLVLSHVVTGDESRRAQALADHPDVRLVASADALFAAPSGYDVVVVSTASGTHAELAQRAVELGKPTVVDKPMALDEASAGALVAAALSAGVPFTVFQNRRWDTDQLTLRRLLAAGELGEVLRYESRFERWRPTTRAGAWRDELPASEGGGLLLDLGAHLVDQALVLFGPVTRVYAEIAAHRGVSDDDDFVALEHSSGVRSHLWAGSLAAAPGPRLRVLGTAGAYLVDALDGQEDQLRATGSLPSGGLVEPPERWGRLVRDDEGTPVPSEPGGWQAFYPAFAAAVRDGAPVPVDPVGVLAAVQVLDAARTSAARHAVVLIDGGGSSGRP
jgi:predicted dehydrogenase